MKEIYVFNDYNMVNRLIAMGHHVVFVRPNYKGEGFVYVFGTDAKDDLNSLINEKRCNRDENIF